MSLPKPDSCRGCPLFGTGHGFVPADGTGRNGVLVILEAAGADEAASGLPTVGKAGYYLWSQLAKVGLQRDDFRIHNALSCQPQVPGFKDNFLAGAPYEEAAISHCSPHLDRTISDHKVACERLGKHPVILALGRIAFKRVMGLREGDPTLTVKGGYHGYVHFSERYGVHVLTADHPSYLMRGQHQLVPLLQYAAQRAVEVATDGFEYHQPHYLCDPTPAGFAEWARHYRDALERDPASTFLSFDIETPMKAKKGEDQLVREDDEDYIILRCAFAFQPGQAVSVPWTAEYLPLLESLFSDPRSQYVTWNGSYDIPRVKNQVEVRGVNHDAMLAWHVLNSALEKKLGFVAPFYAKDARLWKHLSDRQPAFYNAQDADMALRCYLQIRLDLERQAQMRVFDRHIIELSKVRDRMSAAGLMRDEVMRSEAEAKLTRLLDETEAEIQACVPADARRLKVYKKQPKNMEGVKARDILKMVPTCEQCGEVNPKKDHVKIYKKKVNPCAGAMITEKVTKVLEYYKELEWKPSTVALQAYTSALKQQAFRNREGKVTFDEDAIEKLMKKYPRDPLYPLLLNHRSYQKLLGTYIGRTKWEIVVVPDDYQLAPREEWADAV